MKYISSVILALVAAGCAAVPLTGKDDENDFRIPLVCGPEHKQLPCTAEVRLGTGYRFNLLTHCGIEWAHFDGRYWMPKPKVHPPPHWANIEAGTMVLVRPRVALFEADDGGSARFAPAPSSYRPPTCA